MNINWYLEKAYFQHNPFFRKEWKRGERYKIRKTDEGREVMEKWTKPAKELSSYPAFWPLRFSSWLVASLGPTEPFTVSPLAQKV